MAESSMSYFVRQLDPDEMKLLYSAINYFGDNQHPMADENTVKFFNIGYVAYCLGKHFQASTKDKKVSELHERVLDKLLDLTDGLEITA